LSTAELERMTERAYREAVRCWAEYRSAPSSTADERAVYVMLRDGAISAQDFWNGLNIELRARTGMITVSYYRDGYEAARPAINVKLHVAGVEYWPDELSALDDAGAHEIVERAYDEVAAEFWHAARNIAAGLSLGAIEQAGRSGGWLVLPEPDPTGELPDEMRAEWLRAYGQLRVWVGGQLATAAERVRDRARSLAIDEIAEPAARRMYAFENGEGLTIWPSV